MKYFLDTPPPGDMTRKYRMKRLEQLLRHYGLYVHPVPIDEAASDWCYFIVSIDDPFATMDQGQDQGKESPFVLLFSHWRGWRLFIVSVPPLAVGFMWSISHPTSEFVFPCSEYFMGLPQMSYLHSAGLQCFPFLSGTCLPFAHTANFVCSSVVLNG